MQEDKSRAESRREMEHGGLTKLLPLTPLRTCFMQLLCVNATERTCPTSTALTHMKCRRPIQGAESGALLSTARFATRVCWFVIEGGGAGEPCGRRPRKCHRQVLAGGPRNNPSDNPNVPFNVIRIWSVSSKVTSLHFYPNLRD